MNSTIRIYRYIGDEEPPAPDKTFTQEQVNSMLAENKRTLQTENEQLKTDYETVTNQNATLQESARLSDEQTTKFTAEREEIRQRGMNDQQKHAEQLALLENQNKDLSRRAQESETEWKGKYHNELVTNELASACVPNEVHNGVHNPEHITSLLQGRTIVDEETNAILVRDFDVPDEEGKFVKKDVTPAEAVSILSMLDSHKNLFHSKGKVGTGDHNTGGKGGAPRLSDDHGPSDAVSMKDMKEWKKNKRA